MIGTVSFLMRPELSLAVVADFPNSKPLSHFSYVGLKRILRFSPDLAFGIGIGLTVDDLVIALWFGNCDLLEIVVSDELPLIHPDEGWIIVEAKLDSDILVKLVGALSGFFEFDDDLTGLVEFNDGLIVLVVTLGVIFELDDDLTWLVEFDDLAGLVDNLVVFFEFVDGLTELFFEDIFSIIYNLFLKICKSF